MFHDLITNLLPKDPKVLMAMLENGVIYMPYIPFQVSKISFTREPLKAACGDKYGTSQTAKTTQ
jgi:hypothetical protein